MSNATDTSKGRRPERSRAHSERMTVVTMTLARDPAESRLLLRSLRRLTKLGLPIYVGEGGSNSEFVKQIRGLSMLRLCPLPPGRKPTLVNQLRTAFSEAQKSNPDYLLYTEPDKLRFFGENLRLLANTIEPGSPSPPGLVLAARSARSFATFPEGQRIAESFMNRLCSEALGRVGDYTYGPMLLNNQLLKYIDLMPESLGWGWRFFMMAVAHQLRMRIDLCTIGNECPRSQRKENDGPARDYRLRQLVQNVTGLANGWTYLLDEPPEPLPRLIEAA